MFEVSRVQKRTRSEAAARRTSSAATTATPLSNLRVQQNVKAGAVKGTSPAHATSADAFHRECDARVETICAL